MHITLHCTTNSLWKRSTFICRGELLSLCLFQNRELLYQPKSIDIFEMESETTLQKQGKAIHWWPAESCAWLSCDLLCPDTGQQRSSAEMQILQDIQRSKRIAFHHHHYRLNGLPQGQISELLQQRMESYSSFEVKSVQIQGKQHNVFVSLLAYQ